MIRKIVVSVCLVMLAAVLSFGLVACKRNQTGKELTIAMSADWPPMEFVNEKKEITGFDVDLINAIAREGGFQVKIVNAAWDGLFAGIASGEYDVIISSVTITDERRKSMDFSEPYLNAGQILVVLKDTEGVTVLKDLAGKEVGAQIGTTGEFAIDDVKDVKKRTYDDIGLAIADLANKQITAVVTDTPTAANYVLENPQYKGRLKMVGKPFTEEYFGIAVKKGNTEVLEMINKGLRAVRESGELKKLEEKWLK